MKINFNIIFLLKKLMYKTYKLLKLICNIVYYILLVNYLPKFKKSIFFWRV